MAWLLNTKLWHPFKTLETTCPVTEHHITQNLNHQDVIIDYEKAYDNLEQEMPQPILTEENVLTQIIKATWHLYYN